MRHYFYATHITRLEFVVTISQYVVWFMLFSFLGWVYECLYATIRTGKWDNRGFLFGPICPIYGAGVVLALIAFDNELVASGAFPLWAVFIVSMIGSAVLEYVSSYLLERIFHARWWDYSDRLFNINGRVCLSASVFFGLAGVLVAVFLVPATHWVADIIPPIIFEALALILTTILVADTTLAVSALTELVSKVETINDEFNTRIEEARQSASESMGSFTSRLSSLDTFSGELIRELTSSMNVRQKHVLASVRHFRSEKITDIANRAMEILSKANGFTNRLDKTSDEDGKPDG